MNNLRTNETRKICDLISPALFQALGPNVTNNFAAPKTRNTFKTKVEEVDPVRSAERVPFTSSHQLPSLDSPSDLGSARSDKFGKDVKINVAAA